MKDMFVKTNVYIQTDFKDNKHGQLSVKSYKRLRWWDVFNNILFSSYVLNINHFFMRVSTIPTKSSCFCLFSLILTVTTKHFLYLSIDH